MIDSKYMIDDNSADTFENLYRLIMSASVKDTDKINESSSASSEYFEAILKKYCDDKLNNEESCNLLRFVNSYNMNMTNYLIKNFYSKVIGLHEIMNENSIINIITERIYEYIKINEKTLLAGGRYNIDLSITASTASEADKKKMIKDRVVWFLFDQSFKQVLIGNYGKKPIRSLKILPSGEMISEENKTYPGLFTDIKSKCMIPQIFNRNLVTDGEIGMWEYVVDKYKDKNGDIIDIKKSIKNASKNVIYSFEKNFDPENLDNDIINSIVKSVILTGTYNETNPIYFTKKSPIFINFQQFLIHIFPVSGITDNIVKNCATEKEIFIYTNRFPFSFIELHNVEAYSITSDKFSEETYPYIYSLFEPEQLKPTNTKSKTSFVICYKEINSAYREFEYCQYTDILYSYIVNYYSDNGDTNIFSAPNKFFANITDSQKSAITDNVKNIISMPFKKEDVFNYNQETSYDMVGCLKTNSFLAIDLPESGIITYFSGNNKKYALGYGDTKSEQEEINDFLLVYENVRKFYYSTLSSKAFTNEDYYSAYERMFIAVMAIIKTLDYKAENYREIDKMNMTDINNFLESYGLGVVVKYKNFMNQEDYKRQLIRHYNELMKTKGSKEVIDILSKVFDVANTDIDIRKYELVGNHGDTKVLTSSDTDDNRIEIEITETIVNKAITNIVINNISYYENGSLIENDNLSGYTCDIINNNIIINKNVVDSNTTNKEEVCRVDINGLDDNSKNTALCNSIVDYIISPIYGPKIIYGDIVTTSKSTTKDGTKTTETSMTANLAQIKYSPVEKYGFINIPYTSDDELGEILKEMNNLEEYNVFIQSDKYWKSSNVTKNDLDKLNIAVSPTKYLSLDMTKDVDSAYIKAQYVFSAIKEIYLAFKAIDDGNIDDKNDNNINNTPKDVKLIMEIDELGSISPSLVQGFEMCLLLYHCLCTLYRKINNIDSDMLNGKFYGISLPSDSEVNENFISKEKDFISKINAGIIYNDESRLSPLINKNGFIPNKFNSKDFTNESSENTFNSICKYIEEQRFSERMITPSDTTPVKNSGHLVMSTIKDISSLLSLSKQKDISNSSNSDNATEQKDGNNSNDILPFIKYIESVSGKTDPDSNELQIEDYIVAIDNMIRFPIEYLLGRITNPYYDNSLLVNDDYKKWCDTVFENFYIKKNDKDKDIFDIIMLTDGEAELSDLSLITQNIGKQNDIINYIFSDIYNIIVDGNTIKIKIKDEIKNIDNMESAKKEELITKIGNKFFTIASSLRSMFRSSAYAEWSFTNIETNNEEFQFLQSAVEIFISYTVNLYKVIFTRAYNNKYENLFMVDGLDLEFIINLIDNAIVDDELNKKIEKIEDQGGEQ